MGISKTMSGYLDGISCDDQGDWQSPNYGSGFFDCDDALHAVCLDVATKHEGEASMRDLWNSSSALETWSCELVSSRLLNFGPVGGGACIRLWNKHWFDPAVADLDSAIYISTNGQTQDEEVFTTVGTEDWTQKKHTVVTGGLRYLTLWTHLEMVGSFTYKNWVDRVVISTSTNLTVTGLTPGQKIELYRSSDDTLIDDGVCAGGASSVVLDVDAEDFPEQMYMKLYGTDGVTLIETTVSYSMCGGDTWEWTADAGTLVLSRGEFIIYRGASDTTPKSTAVVANLKTPAGVNYPGALIMFETNDNGSVSPSSDTTDASGNAHATLSSLTTAFGLAVVKAQWLGDENVPACSAYILVHVFYDAEVPDPDVGFQLYVEGYPLEFVSGKYGINAQGKPETVQVEIPEWDTNIVPFGLMNVYREGIQEFAGVYLVPDRHLSDAPRVTLQGQDLSFLLLDRVVDLKIYNDKTPQYIINDLLTSFDCGITVGSLGSCAATLTTTITSENLLAAIQRVCDEVCWNFRLNFNRSLDFAEFFGGSPSGAAFTEGIDIFDLDAGSDYGKIANWVRMVGDGIVSTKQDGTNIMA